MIMIENNLQGNFPYGNKMRCSIAVRTPGFPPGDPGSTPGSAKILFGQILEMVENSRTSRSPEPIKLNNTVDAGAVVWRLEQSTLIPNRKLKCESMHIQVKRCSLAVRIRQLWFPKVQMRKRKRKDASV